MNSLKNLLAATFICQIFLYCIAESDLLWKSLLDLVVGLV